VDGKGEISDTVSAVERQHPLCAPVRRQADYAGEEGAVALRAAGGLFEVHTAVPIAKERVLYIQNGDPGTAPGK